MFYRGTRERHTRQSRYQISRGGMGMDSMSDDWEMGKQPSGPSKDIAVGDHLS